MGGDADWGEREGTIGCREKLAAWERWQAGVMSRMHVTAYRKFIKLYQVNR